jgi:hypothetical protein
MAAWVAKRASSDPSVASRILLGKKLISSTPFLGAPLIVHTIAGTAECGYPDGHVPVHESRNLRMLEGDGRFIVNLASIVGTVGFASAPGYALGPRTTSTAQRARR